MPAKRRYEIDLRRWQPVPHSAEFQPRPVARDDISGLAELMLDAYTGTIDYEDETLEDAIEEVRAFFQGDKALLDCSFTVEVDGQLATAILVTVQDDEPFIGYVMTRREAKRTGLARLVSVEALQALAKSGYRRVVFYITDGNRPSEALFKSLGAVATSQ